MKMKKIAAIVLSICVAAAVPADVFAETEAFSAVSVSETDRQDYASDTVLAGSGSEKDVQNGNVSADSAEDANALPDTAKDPTGNPESKEDIVYGRSAQEKNTADTDMRAGAEDESGRSVSEERTETVEEVTAKTAAGSGEQMSEAGDNGEQTASGSSAGPATGTGASGLPSGNGDSTASVDKANLNATIADAKTRNTDNCTAQSAALFRAAIAAAEEVSVDADATADAVKQAEQLLVKAFAALMTKESDVSALEKAKSGSYDGIYTVSGKLMHATSTNQESMGNNALKKPFQVIVSKGVPTLRFEFVPLTSKLGSVAFTGYLGKLNYFPGYTGTAVPAKVTPKACPVESYYDVVDVYNDANTGSDPNMKGKKYPHFVQMPAEFSRNSYFVQVYVSVMEAISAGSGTQFAKVVLDWNTLKQTAGTVTDQKVLKNRTNLLQGFQNAKKAGKVSVKFSDAKQQLLQAAVSAGETALADLNIKQAEVNAAADALLAVQTFLNIHETADKTKLLAAITKADTYLGQTSVYTAASLKTLKTARDKGNTLYGDYLTTQKQADDQTTAINNAISGLKKITAAKVTTAKVNKKKLKAALKKAKKLLKKTKKYTKKSLKKLKKARKAAYKVYKNKKATQAQVDRQTKKLKTAIKKLKKKNAAASSKKTSAKSTGKSSSSVKQEKVDFNNLKDGVYSISGSMVKIDKSTASMSNDAIDHTLKLTVKGGTYYITMRFRGLKINNMLGYLGRLRYFQTGYSLDGNGSPQGSLGDATVESYQTDSSGGRLKDDLGTDYPKEVTFPLISEAMNDGFVPLQVFVPIMESISAGTGTQPVFLKLDRDSVYTGYSASASSDSTAAGTSSLPGSSSGSAGTASGTKTAGASLLGGSTLGTSSLGGSSSSGTGLTDTDEDDADDPDEDAGEENEAVSGLQLSGLGSLDSSGTSEGGTSVPEEGTDAIADPEEASEADAYDYEEDAEDGEEDAQEPPLRKIVKPMGIGTPLLALMLAAVYLQRKKKMLSFFRRNR
ncbi:MAG: NEAT domain-containing protein [Eubacterium sp.]|nr:NEAT domain-containing protein [Eubacterium sp.]